MYVVLKAALLLALFISFVTGCWFSVGLLLVALIYGVAVQKVWFDEYGQE